MTELEEYNELVQEIRSRLDRSHHGAGAPPRKDQWERFEELHRKLGDPRDPLYLEMAQWDEDYAPTEENRDGKAGPEGSA